MIRQTIQGKKNGLIEEINEILKTMTYQELLETYNKIKPIKTFCERLDKIKFNDTIKK